MLFFRMVAEHFRHDTGLEILYVLVTSGALGVAQSLIEDDDNFMSPDPVLSVSLVSKCEVCPSVGSTSN